MTVCAGPKSAAFSINGTFASVEASHPTTGTGFWALCWWQGKYSFSSSACGDLWFPCRIKISLHTDIRSVYHPSHSQISLGPEKAAVFPALVNKCIFSWALTAISITISCPSQTSTQSTVRQRNIKITLLQMILYPVALFQQKIVITNKILHLSPKLCFWISFIHFKSLIHLKEYLFSSAMRHSAFCTIYTI